MEIKPRMLGKGDRIGIIAPAGPVTRAEIHPVIDFLTSKGYKVVQAAHLYENEDYLAGNDDVRIEDLHSMFEDTTIKALFCARGGYGTLRLLDKLDYPMIERNPKILIGYSDITALLLAVYNKTGLLTFHGPVVREFSENYYIDTLFQLLTSNEILKIDLPEGETVRSGTAKGTLIGGNLTVITHMIGTPFLPSMDGVILFIEEKGESPYRIDRMLTHLRLSGILDEIAGLIIGQLSECGDFNKLKKLVEDITSCMKTPVLMNFPVGHGAMNYPIPLGTRVELDADKMTLSFKTLFFEV